MAIPEGILLNSKGSYGVYAGFGSDAYVVGSTARSDFINGSTDSKWSNLSGENYIKNYDNLKNTSNWYALDLCEKYNHQSQLKQFHMLTFYFRNSNGDKKYPSKMIKATLPEVFSYSIGGNWGNPISLSAGDTANALIQQLSQGRMSLSHSVDSFMVWRSPKRLELVFKIPIFDDSGNQTRINYQEALELFSQITLPTVDTNGYYEQIPGPILTRVINSRAKGEKKQKASESFEAANNELGDYVESMGGRKNGYDRLTVQVGGLMLIDWCVIKDIKVTFPNTKQMVLHNFSIATDRKKHKIHLQPLQAELEITVATVESLTQLTYKSMLYMEEQTRPDENKGTESPEVQQAREIGAEAGKNAGYEIGKDPMADTVVPVVVVL